ncbi:MAG: hypothetical protein JWO57_795 [Pseudonocardiales bacterium]|nr:hypothetical protein [Pseudonocardiales bacterium]
MPRLIDRIRASATRRCFAIAQLVEVAFSCPVEPVDEFREDPEFAAVGGIVGDGVHREACHDTAGVEAFPSRDTPEGEEEALCACECRYVFGARPAALRSRFAFVAGLVVGLHDVVGDLVAGVKHRVDAAESSEAHEITLSRSASHRVLCSRTVPSSSRSVVIRQPAGLSTIARTR